MSEKKTGRPLLFKTPEELQAKIDLYFETGAFMVVGKDENGNDIKQYAPTIAGLARYLGMDRRSLTNYANKDEFFPSIKEARQRVEEHLEQCLYGRSVTGVIFNLKNNHGWKDAVEVDNQSSTPQAVTINVVKDDGKDA